MRKTFSIIRYCIIGMLLLFAAVASNAFSLIPGNTFDAFFKSVSEFINLHSLYFYGGMFFLLVAWASLGSISNRSNNMEIEQAAESMEKAQKVFFDTSSEKISTLEKETFIQTHNISDTKTSFKTKLKLMHSDTAAVITRAQGLLEQNTRKFHMTNGKIYSIVSSVHPGTENNDIEKLINEYQNIKPD